MLSETHKKCLKIRNRLYPKETWSAEIYRDAIVERGGSDRVVVEIGCGRSADLLQSEAGRFRMAIGVDVEISVQGGSGDSWRILLADAQALPLPDESLDVIA